MSSPISTRRTILAGALAAGAGLGVPAAASAADRTARTTGSPTPAPVRGLSPSRYSAVPLTEHNIRRAVRSLDAMVARARARTGIPGIAVGVVHRGKVVHARGFGVRRLGAGARVDAHTVFQLASVSKSVAATVVAGAVGKGYVAWSDPVVKHLPDFRLSDPDVTRMVTIGDLFAHRSGIPGAAGDDLEGLGFGRAEIIAKLRFFDLDAFRASYHYTNFGLTTGGEAVARAAGTTWEALSDRLLYEPLGMTSTSSTYEGFVRRPNRAHLHGRVRDGFAPAYIRNPDAQSPAGGVSSSVIDMCTWMKVSLAAGRLRGEQIVDRQAVLDAHTPQIVSTPPETADARSAHYGFGTDVVTTSSGHVVLRHFGAFYVGASTAYALLPAADLGVVVLTNAAPVGAAEALSSSFMDIARTGEVERDWLGYYGPAFDALYVNDSPVAQPPPAHPAPPRELAAYVGNYASPFFGDLRVTERGGVLRVTVGPKHQRARLRHYDGDVFSWIPPGGNGLPISAVTFHGGGAVVATVNLEYLDSYGFGTFTRTLPR